VNILFLDGEEVRHKTLENIPKNGKLISCYTAEKAIELLTKKNFGIVCLDHDLGPASGLTGMDVVDFLCKKELSYRPSLIIIHSFNTSAVYRMDTALDGAGYQVMVIPFTRDLFRGITIDEGTITDKGV